MIPIDTTSLRLVVFVNKIHTISYVEMNGVENFVCKKWVLYIDVDTQCQMNGIEDFVYKKCILYVHVDTHCL